MLLNPAIFLGLEGFVFLEMVLLLCLNLSFIFEYGRQYNIKD